MPILKRPAAVKRAPPPRAADYTSAFAKDWERLADKYAEEVCDIFMRDRRGVIAGWLRAESLLDGGRTALDIGCGIGLLEFYLRERGLTFPIHGVDFDIEKIT